MAMYVSWNGATEVRQWNFYTAQSAAGPFELVATVDKTGFETKYRHINISGWSFAEALDADGLPLERSVIAKTFIPSGTLAPYCDEWACSRASVNKDFDKHADIPEVAQELLSPNRGFNTSKYYADLPSVKSVIHRNIDLGSFILGILLSVTFGVGALLILVFLRGNIAKSMGPLKEKLPWMKDSRSSGKSMGRYARVQGEERDQSTPLPR